MQNNNKTSRVNLLFPFFKISRRIYLLWRRVNIFSNIYAKQSMSEQSLSGPYSIIFKLPHHRKKKQSKMFPERIQQCNSKAKQKEKMLIQYGGNFKIQFFCT
jgi:hypothetical protein